MANFDVELNDEVENFTVEFGEVQRITVDDFDKLRNRPSYAGQTMTHETNIPEVPTAVSQLTNDADYQTGSEVESAISTAVGGEKDAREQADAGLSRDIGVVDGKVDAEADTRERADIALQGAIDDEETARKNADNGLQGQIDAITSSSDVVDIVGTYAELLQYPTAGLGDKDVIKVLQDETHNDAMSYYRWNKSSSTWSYIGSEGPYYTKSETNTLLGDKQDTLTAGSNITISSNNTISATDTTYTAGNGLTLTGTEFSADTTVLQPKLTAGDGINISAQNVISADIDPADFFTASETVDGTGSEMTLNNTIQAKIKSVQMDGDTYQQTYSGKNLLEGTPWRTVVTSSGYPSYIGTGITINSSDNNNIDFTSTEIYRGVETNYIQIANGTTITISFTGTLPNRLYVTQYDSNKTRVSTLNPSVTTVGTVTVTTTQDGYVTVAFANSTSGSFAISNVQMEVGSYATSYEPYTGGIPAPSPSYHIPISVVTGAQTVTITGKNLINIPNFTSSQQGITAKCSNQTIELTGTAGNTYYPDFRFYKDGTYGTRAYRSTVNQIDTSKGFFTEPNSEYKLSIFIEGNTPYAIVEGFETKVTNNLGLVGNQVITINDSERLNFVSISISQNVTADVKVRIQIEKGSTATAYEPYQVQSYTIDLGATELCKISDYQDYIYNSGDDWYVHKEVDKYVFDGDESWSTTPYGTNSWILGNVIYFNFVSNKIQIMSNIATGIAHADRNTTTPNVMYSGQNNVFNFRNTSFTTLSALQTATKDSYVYYAIASPTDTKITDATLISELNALADALGYKDKTIITVSATGTNLPAILEVSAYRNSLAGVLGVIGRAEAA